MRKKNSRHYHYDDNGVPKRVTPPVYAENTPAAQRLNSLNLKGTVECRCFHLEGKRIDVPGCPVHTIRSAEFDTE